MDKNLVIELSASTSGDFVISKASNVSLRKYMLRLRVLDISGSPMEEPTTRSEGTIQDYTADMLQQAELFREHLEEHAERVFTDTEWHSVERMITVSMEYRGQEDRVIDVNMLVSCIGDIMSVTFIVMCA